MVNTDHTRRDNNKIYIWQALAGKENILKEHEEVIKQLQQTIEQIKLQKIQKGKN